MLDVGPQKGLCFLPNKKLRKKLKDAVQKDFSEIHWEEVQEAVERLREPTSSAAQGQPTERSLSLARLLAKLEDLVANQPELHRLYATFVRQLAAAEPTLQLLPLRISFILGDLLLEWPNTLSTTEETTVTLDPEQMHQLDDVQRHSPACGCLLRWYANRKCPLPAHLVLVLNMLAVASADTFALLRTHDTAEIRHDIVPESWQATGTLYGAKKVRERPFYPRLKESGSTGIAGERWGALSTADKQAQTEMDKDEKSCQKFYSKYTERNQTGGLMALWCRHGICIGFHVIPRAEGRNDVFSALYTRWEKPPKKVIYDFACSLAGYCWLREADFFKDTAFYIDQFHSHDHTACTEASFLALICSRMLFSVASTAVQLNVGMPDWPTSARLLATRGRKPQPHSLVFTSAAQTEKPSREENSTLVLLIERYPRKRELWPTWLKLQAL
jgi:hypothetical protein